MAFEIVDGATGAPHISSEDLACMNESVLGAKNCVFPWGSQFAATMESANSLTIASGSGMVGAKRFWNKSNVALTIENGSQNQRRNDLVVARYSKTSGGRESVEPIVLKGTPTTGNPSDPATEEGDLKLWRIPIDGITVGTPVKLFSAYSDLASVKESLSALQTKVAYGGESGTIAVDTSSWSHGFYYLAAFVPYPNDENDMFDALVSKDDRGNVHLKVLHGIGKLAGSVITVSLSWYATITRTLLSRS